MRALATLLLVAACLHVSTAIVRFDTVSIQGLAPNGVIAMLDGDDAYLGLGNRPNFVSLQEACQDALDGTIVVINSGGSLSNLPQLASCWGQTALPFGGPGNTNPDYLLSRSNECPTGYHIGEIFDAAGFFHSDKPVFQNCDPANFECPNRVRVKADSGPRLQDCTGACGDGDYVRPGFITAYLDVGGTTNQSNINAIRFDTASSSDLYLCVSNQAKLQFYPIPDLTGPPSLSQISEVCSNNSLFPASTASLIKHLHSGFNTEDAVNVFYLRSIEFTSAYSLIEDACFPTSGGIVGDVEHFYASALYIATADSCPWVTNIPTITTTQLGGSLDTAALDTASSVWIGLNPFADDATSKISMECADVSATGVSPPWPGLSHIVLQGEGPQYAQWYQSGSPLETSVNRSSFYTGAFAACLYEPDFVAEPVPLKCTTATLPTQVECTFTDRTCVACVACNTCTPCTDCTGCTSCDGFTPQLDCNRNEA